jgi:arginine N-succinyltransferase
MSQFVIRGAEIEDLNQVFSLAEQFALLNLPPDKKVLRSKIEASVESFSGLRRKEDGEFVFLVEDLETGTIAGSSLILAKHGTVDRPHFYFDLIKKDHYSKDLGLGFIHQVLRLGIEHDGPTEIGGLLVDRNYRRRPEKIGRQASLVRFQYMAMFPKNFQDTILCEFAPPLTEEGRSEFWEALGRRFTGLPYQEADMISQDNKEFIKTLFPQGDIYLCLLDSKARLVVGRVSSETKPAQHMLEKLGFSYREQVDPFDGGPHYSASRKDIRLVKESKKTKIENLERGMTLESKGFLGLQREGRYRSVYTPYTLKEQVAFVPEKVLDVLQVSKGEEVWLSPYGN